MAIDVFIEKVEKDTAKLERDLYDEIMAVVIGLIIENRKVIWNAHNVALVGKLDEAFASFNTKSQIPFMNRIKTEMASLDKFYIDYLESIGVESKSLRAFKTLLKRMDDYLDSVGLIEPVKQEVKQYLLNAISSGRSMGSIRKGMREVLGLGDKAGALFRYYRQFLYDSIAQFDRVVSNEFAKQNDLNYFIYKGGLIETSRDFCIARDGLLFRRDQADDWKSDPTLPGYPNVADYDPLIDLGRWNCRHYLLWITDEQAKKMIEDGKG